MFDLGPRYSQESDAALALKAKAAQKKNTSVKFNSNTIIQRISIIKTLIDQYFGNDKDSYELIRTEEQLQNYIDSCIANGIVAIDTETTSLDPITTTIAGFSLYSPNLKSVYVPLNHISYVTGLLTENQITPEFAKIQLERFNENKIKLVFHNAKFDIRVIKNQLNVDLNPYWDTMVAAAILNENEPKGLKVLWEQYCNKGASKGKVDYESLFSGMPFTYVPINVAYFYAARDTEITFELYNFQKQFLDPNEDICKQSYLKLSNMFFNVEMPLTKVLAEIEDTGICINTEYALKLSKFYQEKLDEAKEVFENLCLSYKEKIDQYMFKNRLNNKLSDPINVASPQQIAILLYDILELKSPEKREPRGTGEAILSTFNLPITKAVLDYRGIAKLLSTYINKLPLEVKDKTGRLHGSFSQTTAVTGRLASSDPNLQNIPSRKGKEIRKIFVPSEGYVLISGDYSQQEPRILAHVSQDEHLIKAYEENKDVYAWIASIAFKVPYEECLEFRNDGTTNPEGKKRRSVIKSIVLGIMYSKGVPAIAQDLGISVKEAQNIFDTFFNAFPKVEAFIKDTQHHARTQGYVEMLGGRKRRLPDMQLPKYEFTLIGNKPRNFDPLFDEEDEEVSFEIDDYTKQKYTKMLENCYGGKETAVIRESAKAEGIQIKDNGMKIADAERQCTNSVIQGSAAVITKMAIIDVHKDPILKSLGYRMLLSVHDEINGECPYENRLLVKERVCQLMIAAAAKFCSIPMKVDPCVEVAWTYEYDSEFIANLKTSYYNLEDKSNIEQLSKEFYIDKSLIEKIIQEERF